MEKSAILHADLLDIVFEGRNKEYGAYDLRRTYNKRLRISVAVMLLVTILLCVGQLIAGRQKTYDAKMVVLPPDAVIDNVEQPVEPPPVIPPPPPPQRIQTIQYTAPLIVDEDVPEEVKPPEITELENAKIDVSTQEGDKDLGVVAPPVEDKGKGIIEAPKVSEEDLNKPFLKVEKDADYPGGPDAWRRFLLRNLHVPQVAIENGISGTVIVQFIVDRQGNISGVEAISGPKELRDEAVRVIKKSGKWTPALQNGNNVPSYKKQPIVIRIENEE